MSFLLGLYWVQPHHKQQYWLIEFQYNLIYSLIVFFEYLCEKISVCGFYLGKNLIACFFCKAVKNIVCGKMSGELFLGNFFVLFVCRKISWGKNSFPPKKYPNVSIGLNWGKNIPQYTNAEKTQKGEFSLSKRRRGTILPHVFYHRRVCFC